MIGLIYVMETASVMLQVTSFKLTGKRIFKCLQFIITLKCADGRSGRLIQFLVDQHCDFVDHIMDRLVGDDGNEKISTYENKKVLVLGLAKSGVSAAKLLHELGALVTVNDGKPLTKIRKHKSCFL